MKKFLVLLIVLALVGGAIFVFVNQSEPNSASDPMQNNPSNVVPSGNQDSTPTPNPTPAPSTKLKTEKIFAPLSTGKYYMKILIGVENLNGKTIKNAAMEITVDGDSFATDVKDAGYGMIIKDGFMYYIMHDAKQYTKMSLQPDTKQEMLADFTDEDYASKLVGSGEKELNGTKYYYEEFNFDESISTLYFDNDNLKYIETSYTDGTPNTLIQVVEISNNVKSSLLNIPSDYTSLDMNI